MHRTSTVYIPCQNSKYCAHNKSHNEGGVLDGIDLHSSCVWIQTEVVREVEAKETAQAEHLCNINIAANHAHTIAKDTCILLCNSCSVNNQSRYHLLVVQQK